MWGVWANFINKINEKIEFELRNSDKKKKNQLSEEDKTVKINVGVTPPPPKKKGG